MYLGVSVGVCVCVCGLPCCWMCDCVSIASDGDAIGDVTGS